MLLVTHKVQFQPCPNKSPLLPLPEPAPAGGKVLPGALLLMHLHLENRASPASCTNNHSRGNIYMFNITAWKNKDGDKVVCGS